MNKKVSLLLLAALLGAPTLDLNASITNLGTVRPNLILQKLAAQALGLAAGATSVYAALKIAQHHKQILHYVKENPVKSSLLTAGGLTALGVAAYTWPLWMPAPIRDFLAVSTTIAWKGLGAGLYGFIKNPTVQFIAKAFTTSVLTAGIGAAISNAVRPMPDSISEAIAARDTTDVTHKTTDAQTQTTRDAQTQTPTRAEKRAERKAAEAAHNSKK